MAKVAEPRDGDCGSMENDAHESDEALRLGTGRVRTSLGRSIERLELAGRDRLPGISKKMSFQGGVYLQKWSARRQVHESEHARHPDVFRTVVLHEVTCADAADVSGDPCANAVPTGRVDHAVVNQADQIIQA